ncbi:VPS35 endosomal protein sorting factor-like [Aplysia californica]|uniref:VPS35 endosomal protein sorting factor-like n=1 Tax=Aplysia californica TaxID=6500 RepID=A0ABM0JTL9_APLCA|nr:VPS35 endosomal protein sorting factor-like [Aplysia californica]
MAAYEWHPKRRNYVLELGSKCFNPVPASSHPLKAITVTDVQQKKGNSGAAASSTSKKTPFVDPLSFSDPLSGGVSTEFEGSDPLSMMSAPSKSSMPSKSSRSNSVKSQKMDGENEEIDDSFEPWSLKRAGILTKYTTSEKLSITTSFLSTGDQERVVIRSQAQAQTGTVSDKVKNRLEQLDDFEEGSVKEMLNLSQQDYVKRIEELNQALITAWDGDQRVKALKIVIQCSKLLADTSVIPFYPSKFVLITDILDTFGRLVYDRLLDKAQTVVGSNKIAKLPAKFTSDEVPEAAKETCRNWFFKIASIRELIPRFYVEAAMLRSYNFLRTGESTEVIDRLSYMSRGIGDPLVAVYARCYLCRVGILIAPKFRPHIPRCFEDFIITFPQVQGESVQNILATQKVEMPRYLTLISPALDWILQCLAHQSSETLLTQTLERCKEGCNNALMINSIMSAFKPQYIANRALFFTELIKSCEDTGLPKHMLYRTLGLCLVVAETPEDQQLSVLNEVWKAVVKLKNPTEYISCAEVWIEFVVKHFGKREINTFIGDIIKHMTPDRAYEEFYPQLQSVVSKILAHQHDFSLLFSLEKFLPFIDMFQREAIKVEVCKCVLESFNKHQLTPVNDPVVINAMMFLGKIMHDSVDALTLDDEKRVIGNLLCGFIHLVQFGRDFEQQLSFYVEVRAAFSNLDSVLVTLIQSVNNLAVETRKIVKGNHSRKTAAFVRACAAYCFITVPSLQSVFSQLQLYLLSGQVALLNQCYSQGDAFLKAAISLIPDMPKTMDAADVKSRSSEPFLMEYLYSFISTLLVTPDNPDVGVMYLLRGLLNVLQDYTWDQNGDLRIFVYTRVLAMLSSAAQEEYLYHFDKVDSNDSMYGSDPKFVAEVQSMAATLIGEILAHLKTISAPEFAKRQSTLALELVATLICHGDLSQTSMASLTSNLWTLAQKNGQADVKVMKKLQENIKTKAAAGNAGCQALAPKLTV